MLFKRIHDIINEIDLNFGSTELNLKICSLADAILEPIDCMN